ncbi:hypothetical protein FPSE5266_20302 [Fusarium pseudograminearum]|nr:hypothetical protein FPSE5266_20302 [Fusarium pseudograminearum]
MIAGTLGPVASAFSICSLAEPWRQSLVTGADIQSAVDIPDPSWLVVIEAIQLLIGIIANLFLLLHMARRVRFGLALPVTIVGWYTSSICRIALSATAARPFKDKGLSNEDVIWSQAFYYGMFAAILYFADATLLALTFWGAYTNRYEKSLPLTNTQPRVDFTSRSQNNVGDLPTQVHLQLLLISEIREILGHLKETQPHHYTFEQWAWYLKLIGEDESDPRTHGSVHQQECDHTVLRKWSWIGSQSPLISTNGESEWILGRLMERLQLSLTGENKGQEIR